VNKESTLVRGLRPERVAPSGPQKSGVEEARSQNLDRARSM
jgi:hypothetical protein